ncbi:TPA: fimbria/pilus outer membrane usher protein [Pseudomonas putida]|nr:fimbria/pilus outer membrane usher protein [Pseudomonas putida]
MKKTLSVLALCLSSSIAMADIINFEGTVRAAGTCPIEVVTPGGPALPLVYLGDFKAATFDKIGMETAAKQFALRIPGSCVTATQSAFATFTAGYNADKDNPKTNSQGYALAPYLRPYRANQLVLQLDQLDPEIEIENGATQVVPRRGAVVLAEFAARRVNRLVLTLLQADGQPLPFGAQISDGQEQVLGVVGQGGQALIATHLDEQQLSIRWTDEREQLCRITLTPATLPLKQGYRLHTLQCPAS